MMRDSGGAAGFTLFEMLIAMTIMLFVVAGVFSVFNPSQGAFQAQPEVSDMQQRLRMGVDTLHKDLVMAGAGTYSGAAVGTLTAFFAPILPYRVGTQASDPASGVFFRSDAISIMYVPTTASQCSIRDQMPQPSSEVKVNAQPGCPARDPLCGFEQGMRVLIFDDTGSWDTFTITNVQSDALHLQHRDDTFSKAYGPGAIITQVSMHTYWLRSDVQSSQFQLMHYDGYRTDEPVVDNVVGFETAYLGESEPPVLHKPVTDPVGPWTTYGPKPPAMGVDNRSDSWGAGENCAFMVDPASGAQVPRLAQLGPPGSLAALAPSQLTDGPWCPDGANPNRYDADLLRIRQIRVRLRVQTGEPALRGPAGTLYTRGGQGQAGDRLVPDQEIRFDVSPRNLNLGR
ncbi:MAG: prepilin-type N-terminal cleavage/methylation domain-containing protein [Acidobacteriota bacterium]